MIKTSTQKIISGLLSSAMVLTLVVGFAVPASAQVSSTTTTTTTTSTASSYAFTRNLTVGSTGADVTALQTLLAAKGFFTATPTGYFGSITKAALAQFQASVGISPAAGYFGPITMAYLASMTTTTGSMPGCAAGAMYNSTTGAPCSSTSMVPGCAAGAAYSSTTGAPCATSTTLPAGCTSASGYSPTTGQICTPTTTSSANGSGILTVTQSATPASNANITTSVDVPVWGVQLMASGGDVSVNRLLLDVSDTIQSSPTVIENPGNFINAVKVWDGTNVIFSEPLTQANFITGTTSTDYYLQIPNVNFLVPAGATKTLVVSFSTSGSIDTSRTIVIKGYGASSLLAYSGSVQTSYDVSGISLTQTFQKPGQSTLSVGTDASNPVSGTYFLDPTLGAQGVTLLAWNALSSSGQGTVVEVDANVNYSGTAPTAVYLYNGSTILASRTVSGSAGLATVQFTQLSSLIPSGTTKVYTIKIDEPSNASAGSTASTTVTKVYYQQSNGSTLSVSPNVTSNAQTFYKGAPAISFVSASAAVSNNSNTGSTTAVTGTMVIKVHPQPGQMLQPVASDFVACFATTLPGTSCKKATVSLTFSPTPTSSTAPLSANSDTTITLNASINPSQLQGVGAGNIQYYFFLANASTTVNDTTGNPVSQTTGTTTLSNFYAPTTILVNS